MVAYDKLYELNRAIAEAFGLDVEGIRTFRLEILPENHYVPTLTVTHIVRDEHGKRIVEDGELAVATKRYKLVEIEEDTDDDG